MKKIVVQKYGGSSVSTVESIKQVAHRIMETQKKGYQVVVVVSAMGNTTNELISLAKMVSLTPSGRELDLLISVGERVSMSLLAMAIQELGGRAKSFTGSQSGIITTPQHLSASIIEVRPERIYQALEENYIAIVAGFQGMSTDREVTTLGRGGSDTTAVALTAALDAEFCEICSDVSGVYSTDPRVVPSALLLDELSLDTAISMAENGAKVLHVEALKWCKRAGVVLVANATENRFGGGTKIRPSLVQKEQPVISFDRSLVWEKFDQSNEALRSNHSAIRHGFSIGTEERVVLDTRNIHGFEGAGKIASVSIIGMVDILLIKRVVEDCQIDLFHWTKDAGKWTGFLSPDRVDELVFALHQAIFSVE